MSIKTTIQILEDMKNGVPVEKYLTELYPLIYNTDKYDEICGELSNLGDIETNKIWTELRGNIVCPEIRIGYLEKAIEYLPYDKLRSINYQLAAVKDQIQEFKPDFDALVLGYPNYLNPLGTSEAILLANDEAYLLRRKKNILLPTKRVINIQKDKYFNGMPQMKDFELRNYFLEILKHPTLIKDLTEYQLSKVREYAQQDLNQSIRVCIGFLEMNKGYNYPPEYIGREFDYWTEKSQNYQDATFVINLINEHLTKINQPSNPNKGGIKFYNGDPEKGGHEINLWNFLKVNGTLDRFQVTPTHSFKLLKPFRLELFEKEKQKFIAERAFNDLETGGFEINVFYLKWLEEELESIKGWLSDKEPNGQPKKKQPISNQIEIGKYSDFINGEIGRLNSGTELISNFQENQQPDQEKGTDFNKMPLKKVEAFFKPLTELTSKNGEPFLTHEQLQSFIKRAFYKNLSEPKQTFNVAPTGEKLFLCKGFYEFYLESISSKYWYDTEPDCQNKYIKLLSDNFTNWTFDQVKVCFRSDKTRKSWRPLQK